MTTIIVSLLPCSTGYIRAGVSNGKRGYVLMDILPFLGTASKASTVANRLPKRDSFRCGVEGIPGRPNILVTLKGLSLVLDDYPHRDKGLDNFVDNEFSKPEPVIKETVLAPVIPAIDNLMRPMDREEYVELVPDDKELKKINKRLKRMEQMLTIIYEELME